MLDIPLKIPLAAFYFARLFECDHPGAARVEMLHEALDRAALPSRIASFEQDDDPLVGFLDPGLQLQQLRLQREFLLLIVFAEHFGA